MSAIIIGLLVGLSAYLAVRLHSAVNEITALRTNIASLKRRIAQH